MEAKSQLTFIEYLWLVEPDFDECFNDYEDGWKTTIPKNVCDCLPDDIKELIIPDNVYDTEEFTPIRELIIQYLQSTFNVLWEDERIYDIDKGLMEIEIVYTKNDGPPLFLTSDRCVYSGNEMYHYDKATIYPATIQTCKVWKKKK